MGQRALRDFEPEDLYEVIRQRYERGATVWTSNRAESEWYPLFGDELLASAAMDRLLHHATDRDHGRVVPEPSRGAGG